MTLDLSVTPRRIALVLALIAVYLAVQSIGGKLIQAAIGGEDTIEALDQLVNAININRETAIPTWYSTLLLAGAALLLALIARAVTMNGGPYVRGWWGLSAIFLYLSMDEAAALHEKLTTPLGEALDTVGYLYFAWVIVGALFFLLVAALYFRFWRHLPPRYRRLVVAAALVYVTGSLIIESISANQWYLNDGSTLLYSAIGTVEELLEMLGVVLFIYTLLSYLAESVADIRVTLRQPRPAPLALGLNAEPAPLEPEYE